MYRYLLNLSLRVCVQRQHQADVLPVIVYIWLVCVVYWFLYFAGYGFINAKGLCGSCMAGRCSYSENTLLLVLYICVYTVKKYTIILFSMNF